MLCSYNERSFIALWEGIGRKWKERGGGGGGGGAAAAAAAAGDGAEGD